MEAQSSLWASMSAVGKVPWPFSPQALPCLCPLADGCSDSLPGPQSHSQLTRILPLYHAQPATSSMGSCLWLLTTSTQISICHTQEPHATVSDSRFLQGPQPSSAASHADFALFLF